MSDGIPSQLKKLNDRLDRIEDQQQTLQRAFDRDVLPAVKIATVKAEAAMEEVARQASKKVDRKTRRRR